MTEATRAALRPAPEGLDRCGRCGELQGICTVPGDGGLPGALSALCRCHGYRCGACGGDLLYRPISERWSEGEGRLLHVAAALGMRPCRECGERRWTRVHPELDGRCAW